MKSSSPTGRLDVAFLEGAEDLEDLLEQTHLRRLTAELRPPRLGVTDFALWGALAILLIGVWLAAPPAEPPNQPEASAVIQPDAAAEAETAAATAPSPAEAPSSSAGEMPGSVGPVAAEAPISAPGGGL